MNYKQIEGMMTAEEAADFKDSDFTVCVTQGGGFAKWSEDHKRYIFITPPDAGVQLGTGDFVPEEWGIQPVEFCTDVLTRI